MGLLAAQCLFAHARGELLARLRLCLVETAAGHLIHPQVARSGAIVAANLARGAIDARGEHLLAGDAAEIEIVVGNMDRFGLRSGGAEGETGGGEGSEGEGNLLGHKTRHGDG